MHLFSIFSFMAHALLRACHCSLLASHTAHVHLLACGKPRMNLHAGQMLVRRLASEHVSVSARLLDVGDGSSRQPVFTPSPAALTLLLILAPSRWRHYPRRRLGCAAPPSSRRASASSQRWRRRIGAGLERGVPASLPGRTSASSR